MRQCPIEISPCEVLEEKCLMFPVYHRRKKCEPYEEGLATL